MLRTVQVKIRKKEKKRNSIWREKGVRFNLDQKTKEKKKGKTKTDFFLCGELAIASCDNSPLNR